jgi:hypothetical protein
LLNLSLRGHCLELGAVREVEAIQEVNRAASGRMIAEAVVIFSQVFHVGFFHIAVENSVKNRASRALPAEQLMSSTLCTAMDDVVSSVACFTLSASCQ